VTVLPRPGRERGGRDGHLGRLAAAIAVSLLIGAGCTGHGRGDQTPSGTPTSPGAKREVKIAYVGALSGPGSATVLPGYQAAQLAFELADEGKLGSLPVTVTLVPEDTKGSADLAPSVTASFAGDESFVGVIGPTSSVESQAAGALLNTAGIPFITPSASDPGLAQNGWTHWFRAIGNYDYQGPSAAGYIMQELKPNCVVVASDDTTYGQTLAGVVQGALQGQGVTIVQQLGAVHVPTRAGSGMLVAAVRASTCTVVFYGGVAAQAGPLRAQMSRAGLTGVTLVGGDGIETDAFVSTAGQAGDGTVATCFCADVTTSSDPAARSFVAAYSVRFGDAPGIYSAEAWDIAQMYIAALKAGKASRESITGFFHTLQGFQGVTKSYSFASNGELEPSAAEIYLYRVQDGAWTTLGTASQLLTG
jgi:branched-chain amino acid transport system substrate-binding protein